MNSRPRDESGPSAISPERIGVIGLGAMGSEIAHNFSDHGVKLMVHDTDENAQADFLSAHPTAEGAASLRDFAPCDMVVLILPSSDIVDSVVRGSAGVLACLRPGSIVVDMGSSVPGRTRSLSRDAARLLIDVVDAPVSGGVARARKADLAAMVGGDRRQFARVSPLLRFTASTIIHTGVVGTGHAAKALNNLLSATSLVATAEVLILGRKSGLDPAVLLSILNSSSGRTQASETKFEQHILPRTYSAGFSARLMDKDIAIALDLAAAEDVDLAIGTAVGNLWTSAVSSLEPRADHTEVVRVLEQVAGISLSPETGSAHQT